MIRLSLKDIHEDPTLQLRDGLDRDRIEAMREFVTEGGTLPPITVVGDDNTIADGHHRYYLAVTMGRIDIEADQRKGTKADAVALAIMLNDMAGHEPLTQPQVRKGIQMLLEAGWSQDQIATATKTPRRTIGDIANRMVMRGKIAAKPVHATGRKPKPVAVLPKPVADALTDTHLTRIAEVPVAQQVELAEAVVATNLSEPRTREAIQTLKANPGMTPTQAVTKHAPIPTPPMPATIHDLSMAMTKRMLVLQNDTVLWNDLATLAAQSHRLTGASGLALILADLAVRFDHAATALNTPASTMKAVSA